MVSRSKSALKHNGRAVITALAFCAACLAMASCGLEEYVYLYPPNAVLSGDIFTFSNDTQNDPTVFYGYRVLYRFYASASSADTAVGTVTSLYTSYPTTIYDKMKTQAGFRDVLIGPAESDELRIDAGSRNDAFSVDLDFQASVSSGGAATMVVSEGIPVTVPDISGSVSLYQSIEGESLVGFTQSDLVYRNGIFEDGIHYDELEGKTYLLIYVMAYGYNSSFGTVYSEPKRFIGTTSYVVLNIAP